MAFILAALALPFAINHIGETYVEPAVQSVGRAYDSVVGLPQRIREKRAREAAEQENQERKKRVAEIKKRHEARKSI